MARESDELQGTPGAHAQDLELARRALLRDPGAVERLVERLACIPAMVRALHRRMGAPLTAHELAEADQAVLASLWTKLASYEGRAALESWAFRFAQLELHKALDRQRRGARVALVDTVQLQHVAQPSADEALVDPATLRECVERLGSLTAEIITLRHYDQLAFEDIARLRRESVSTIKARYYRGIGRLRGLLEPHLRRER